MCDILFVHPNAAADIYQDLSKEHSAIEPPIWAGMLTVGVRAKGFTTQILDCEAEHLSIDESAIRIKAINPKLIAIVVYGQMPSASTQNMCGTSKLAKHLPSYIGKEQTKIILIGGHPSALPEKSLREEAIDFVCEGEGLYTCLDLLNEKKNNSWENIDYSKVRGLWYWDKDHNIQHTQRAPLIENLDNELPGMPWDELPMQNYRTARWHALTNNGEKQPFASLYTSLGCPYACSFCCINAPFDVRKFRFWSPEHTIKQFDYFVEHGIRNVKIADELFLYNKKHFLRLCELINERGYGDKLNIWSYSRYDTVKEEYLPIIKKAGIRHLGIGIESASQHVREGIEKGRAETIKIKDAISLIQKYDICIGANYIFGLPEDTLETMQETLDLSIELNTEFVNYYSAQGYPGSPLHEQISKEHPEWLPENNGIGWIGYSQYSYECMPLPTNTLSAKEVLAFRDKAWQAYYSRPEFLDMLEKKFGPQAVVNMKKTASIKLKRKLLGD